VRTLEERKNELWDLCERFIAKQRVTCPEATCEDRIYENAPEFVEQIADVVGYLEEEE